MYNKMIIVRNTKSTQDIHLILVRKRQEKRRNIIINRRNGQPLEDKTL
jgi:hypothetical protein